MLLLPSLVIATAIVKVSAADRTSNFPISAEVAHQYECGDVCQSNINATNANDLEDFDLPFDFDFYTTAGNFSGSEPDDVLKLEFVDLKLIRVPAGIVAYRIQYASVDLDNSTVPATAFVAFPFVRKKDPFNLVAYAHGSSGVFRSYAPSTSSNFYDYDTWIPLIFAGYAVVGTDYVGLGNNYTVHKYISTRANARDVYWSAIAAQKAFTQAVSQKWVSVGHSQSGGASWKLSEDPAVQGEESGYLGGVAIAPNTRIYDAFIESISATTNQSGEELQEQGSFGYLPSIYFTLQAVYPNYTAPFLSDLARKRFTLGAVTELCAATLPAVVSDLNTSDVIGDLGEAALVPLKAFQDLNAPAQGDRTSRPLLVIQGENDTTMFAGLMTKSYEQACEAGNRVKLSIYPGLEHSSVSGASAPEWLGFIEDLFRGQGLENCS